MDLKKKTAVLILAILLLTTGGLFAQEWYNTFPASISPGNWILNAGVGFGNPIAGDLTIPPILASVDYALSTPLPFTVGGFVSYAGSKYDYYYATIRYSFWAFGGRFSWHPNFGVEKLDTYATINLGYLISSGSTSYKSGYDNTYDRTSSYNRFYWGGTLGARYFFIPKIGAFAELGYSNLAFITAGVTVKF